ncbi:putative DNA-binding transcriptional regulator YafY [Hydrogenispora ethanolica]|uniref:Putative DNA-binding transcriptional regulator YafY n=1 Tax=Hydrogenispora ethanolica TaxID=1082276 RepID=A0A4V2QDX0_HYDET|nr:WYL domain-containing protein [Hydrogenispora ethanolica]TCL65917.1 putative DNA-binding transcriptional regulator YafY [Hydrogenispora ethanolica]
MPKGDRLPRLLKLIHTIQNHPGLSSEELARECGIGSRQIFRDLRVLDYAGVPLYNDNGYRLAENFLLQDISFSLDEALSLLYGLKLVERQKALFPVKRVKERIMALLPRGLRDEIENLDGRVDVVAGFSADYSMKGDLFRNLNLAMRESKRIELEYYCFSRDDSNVRTIDPYHLIFKDGFWYLVGLCHWRKEQRQFRVDRIRKLRVLPEKFVPPPEILAASPLGAAWGIELGEVFQFTIRFWGESARFVRETQFHPEQQLWEEAGGTLRFTAKGCNLAQVARWVLTFGGEAEVLKPQSLRQMVVRQLAAGLERYSREANGCSLTSVGQGGMVE